MAATYVFPNKEVEVNRTNAHPGGKNEEFSVKFDGIADDPDRDIYTCPKVVCLDIIFSREQAEDIVKQFTKYLEEMDKCLPQAPEEETCDYCGGTEWTCYPDERLCRKCGRFVDTK